MTAYARTTTPQTSSTRRISATARSFSSASRKNARLVVKEERAVRKTADQVVAPVLPYEPVFPHVRIIPKNPGTVSTMLYQYALTLLILALSQRKRPPALSPG